MNAKNKYQSVTILLLVVTILVMSVGFAAYSTNLNMNADLTVKGASWNIAFDQNSYKKTDGSVTLTQEPTITGTSITYAVTLAKPGDFYEYKINVKNTGTFNAKLDSITMTDITDHSKYLDYTVTHNQQTYTKPSQTIQGAPTLNALNGVETITVKIAYKAPESASDLPQQEVKVTLTTTLNYVQV